MYRIPRKDFVFAASSQSETKDAGAGDDYFVVDLPLTPERIRMARPAVGRDLEFIQETESSDHGVGR